MGGLVAPTGLKAADDKQQHSLEQNNDRACKEHSVWRGEGQGEVGRAR